MKSCLGEALRYMGVRDENPRAVAEAQAALARVQATARPRFAHAIFPCAVNGQELSLGPLSVASRSLAKNLENCQQVIVLAATLGLETDRLVQRTGLSSASEAYALQAAAAAWLEACCDHWQERFVTPLAMRPRFSPGYGDCSLALQAPILHVLQAGARIGLTVTDAGMLAPTKSVTAFIGLCPQEAGHTKASPACEGCEDVHCPYRKEATCK